MSTENRFNLIEEPWIPIVDVGQVSLRQIFTHSEYRALGGNPVQKIALTKLLLAIAQAAATPADDEAWAQLGEDRLAQACLEYLEKWHDRFWLYGDKPFLQLNNLKRFKEQPIAALDPCVATGNTTLLFQSQKDKEISDAEWALIVLVDQNFSVKHNLAYGALTSDDSKGKGKATKSGPALGPGSYLHSFMIAGTLIQTIKINFFSLDVFNGLPFKFGINESSPVWELDAIADRDSKYAQVVKDSYYGRLCPLSRFIVKSEQTIQYCEGIVYPSHQEGGREISATYFNDKKSGKTYSINVKLDKRPWRELSALLSFFNMSTSSKKECLQLKLSMSGIRIREIREISSFGIWSGGLLLSGDSYSQFSKGDDDYVESTVWMCDDFFTDPSGWIDTLGAEMIELEILAQKIKNSIYAFHKREIKDSKERDKRADSISQEGTALFWQLSERLSQLLFYSCASREQAKSLRKQFVALALQAFDSYCPNDTARQLDAWAKNRPNFANYLNA